MTHPTARLILILVLTAVFCIFAGLSLLTHPKPQRSLAYCWSEARGAYYPCHENPYWTAEL